MADDSYDNALEMDGRNLVALARSGDLPAVAFRDAEIAAVLEQLDRRRSVLLVGPSGVGKTLVMHGVAHAMAARNKGTLFEISTTGLLSGTRYIGEWQTKVTRVFTGAADKGAILHITDTWNLPRCGRTSSNDGNMLDSIRPFIESGRLQLLAEASPEILRAMQRVPGFVRLFQTVEIAPLSDDKVDAAIVAAAARRKGAPLLDAPSRGALVKLTSRFLAARPQPGPALALLAQVLDYQDEKRGIGENEPITPAFIERVFSITSGLPAFVVSRGVTIPASEIRAWFADRIVGQTDAIGAVVETIALFKAGLHDPQKPIGTFLFVGPTGVGKTELARALATFVFGSPQRLLRFDLSEFKDYSSFELLLGDPQHPDKPARLIDPVRAHPFQVVLFDELEKAHSNVWDLLLPLLDEGRLTTPNGETVDFRNTVLIATSNVGAQEAAGERTLGFGKKSSETVAVEDREGRARKALESAFRPEFLNRFQHTIVFHPLSAEQLRTVARQEMARVLRREGIAAQDLVVDVDDEALDLVIAQGLDTRFGARALKREVQRRIVLPLAMTLMEREVAPGSILKVAVREGELRVRVLPTEESRAHLQEVEPSRRAAATRADLVESLDAIELRVAAIAAGVNEEALAAERDRLAEQRGDPSFWRDVEAAEKVQRELDRVTATIERLSRLRERVAQARDSIQRAAPRGKPLDFLALRVRDLDGAALDAERELLRMGWEGSADALVEIRPTGGTGREARDLLARVYGEWAPSRKLVVEWLREPREDDEPVLLGVRGLYAYGLLRAEAGLHRLRLAPPEDRPHPEGTRQGRLVVAVVRVAAWSDRRATPVVVAHRPLKAVGQYGGKIRSRLECDVGAGAPLVLQNGRILSENRELAADVVASWAVAPVAPDLVVRRYDTRPPLVRDPQTNFSSGRPDALTPAAFDVLLCARVDAGLGK